MPRELESRKEIRRHTERLLQKADAAGSWPTPVDNIVEASKIHVNEDESPFSESAFRKAPKYLKKAIAAIKSSRVHAILDRQQKVVHLDPGIEHPARKNFLKLHEVVHEILPWQDELAFADDLGVLSRPTYDLFEREANHGAADLYFQGDRFAKMASEYKTGIAAVAELSNKVGSSLRATLRQYAECHRGAVCAIYLAPSPCQSEPLAYRRFEVSQSAAWTERFGSTWPQRLGVEAFPFLACINDPALSPSGALTWPDLNSEPIDIRAEAHPTSFGVALLIWVPRREIGRRKLRLEVARA